jgi:hypothetical protein
MNTRLKATLEFIVSVPVAFCIGIPAAWGAEYVGVKLIEMNEAYKKCNDSVAEYHEMILRHYEQQSLPYKILGYGFKLAAKQNPNQDG